MYIEDVLFLECFKLIVEFVVKSFKFDIILSVNGVDIYYCDLLIYLNCMLYLLYEILYFVKYLVDFYMNGKVIMFGGGGYNIWRVVLCVWSYVFLSLID